VGAQIKDSQAKQQFEQERAGVQMGADIAKNKAQSALQSAQIAANSRKETPTK
jgi:hypothetical protein